MPNLMTPQQIERLLREIHEATEARLTKSGQPAEVKHCPHCNTATWHHAETCLRCHKNGRQRP